MKTNTKIKSLLALFSFLLCSTSAKAQVTIGLGEEPSRAALLELKTQQPNGEYVTSDKGGLVLSRVKLTNKATLEPFIPTNDPDWVNASTSKIKELHKGLLVYNLTTTAPFAEGLYMWDGTEWREYKAANNLVQTADNGLTLANNRVQWGGDLINATTSIGVDASQRALQFNITNNTDGSTDDTKGLFIKGLKVEGSTRALTVTDNGKLGIASGIPARLAFFQSTGEQGNIAAEINAGDEVVVSFVETDEVTNNLVDFFDANDEFIIREDGILEISASVAYSPHTGLPTSGTNICLLNATLQRKRAGTGTWESYSSVRNLWVGIATAYRQTLNIPPILIEVYQGDRLRLIIQRPPNTGGSGYLGSEHANATSGTATGIGAPFGTNFSKSIKILAIE